MDRRRNDVRSWPEPARKQDYEYTTEFRNHDRHRRNPPDAEPADGTTFQTPSKPVVTSARPIRSRNGYSPLNLRILGIRCSQMPQGVGSLNGWTPGNSASIDFNEPVLQFATGRVPRLSPDYYPFDSC